MPTIDASALGASERLRAVRERVEEAARRAGRPSDSVRLIAVSKFQSAAAIEEALEARHRIFGESRVQEVEGKWSGLGPWRGEVELHLIGRLQSNKARAAIRLFDVIHTIDRAELASALGAEMRRAQRRPCCFVQVNTGREPQKGGVLPESADQLIEECVRLHGLPIEGVMAIPPEGCDPEPHFDLLARIAQRNGLPLLSMGMSRDFERAIAYGATHVRVGEAIFGAREGAR